MIKLHLGSGKRDFGPSWTHIDGGDFPHLQGHDITKLPFGDNSVDIIYASHVVAYFDRTEIVSVLKEWHRVLVPGGVCRLATPDFLRMSCLYCDGLINLDQILGPLYGKMPMGDQTIYHKTTYDLQALTNLLKEVGFKRVQEWNWREIEHGHIDDHSQSYLPHMRKDDGVLISLNLEGIK